MSDAPIDPSASRGSAAVPSPWPQQAFSFGLFYFAYYGYVGVFSPYASLFFAQRGMSAAQIGVLMSLMQVMRIFGPNLWGWAADRSHARVVVLRLTACTALAAFCGMFIGSGFWQFFVVMAAINLMTAAQAPLAEALMLTEMRGDLTHYGKLRLWGSVGFIAAVTVAGELLDRYGIGTLPTIAFLLLALVVAGSFRLFETQQPTSAAPTPSMRSILRKREVLAFFTSTGLMVGAHSALYVFYSLYLAQHGYSKSLIGLMWSIGVLAEIFFFYFQAPIFRRFGVRRLMMAGLVIAVGRFLVVGLCAESLIALVLAQILHAATFGAHHSASIATLQRWFSGRLQARGQALFTSISYGLGGSLGGLGLSLMWEHYGPQSVFLVAALMAMGATCAGALSFHWQTLDKELR